jgi:hypothetical protein
MLRAILPYLTVVSVGTASLLLSPAPAEACSCSRPGVEVSPRNDAKHPAPLNPEIRVSVWIGELKLDEDSLVVQTAGKKPVVVEVERRASTSGSLRIVTLTPKAPLAPETRYEVRAAAPGGGKPATVGEFTTGKASDDKPPEWSGVGAASLQVQGKNPGMCSTGDAWVKIELAGKGASDDGTPADALVYGVWLDDAGAGKPAVAGKDDKPPGPPLTVVKAWGGSHIALGRASLCQADNFSLPKAGKGKNELKLKVAPIDLAGKVGKLAPVTVDLSARPAKP